MSSTLNLKICKKIKQAEDNKPSVWGNPAAPAASSVWGTNKPAAAPTPADPPPVPASGNSLMDIMREQEVLQATQPSPTNEQSDDSAAGAWGKFAAGIAGKMPTAPPPFAPPPGEPPVFTPTGAPSAFTVSSRR